MSIAFKDLGLKKQEDVFKADLGGGKVLEIRKNISSLEKSIIVNSAIAASTVDGTVDRVLLDSFFHFNLVDTYTNIEFTEEEIGSFVDTFDLLETNGVVATVISHIDADEYEYLYHTVEKTVKDKLRFTNAISSGMGVIAAAKEMV